MKMQWFQYAPDDDGTVTATTTDDTATASDAGDSGTSSDTDTDFLFVDVSPWEANPQWQAVIDAPHFVGAILKASQGIKGSLNDGGWFKRNWPQVKDIGGDRYGSTWFRGAYLFLNLWQDGAAQADNYLEIIDDAGGWDAGDIIPIVDVELGNDGANGKPRNRNNDVSKQDIIDCTTACAERLREVTGRNVMLYGRGAMRDKGIKDKMGCDVVWNPCYTATIVMNGLEAWTLDDVVLWQYCGDGTAVLPDQNRFPRSIPGFGEKADISVYIEGANKPSLDSLIRRLSIGTVTA
jgi:GH25 family lysozyme M1 (1,4-beta-N-acetylmuramidase)